MKMPQFYELFILLEKNSGSTYLLVSMFSSDVKTQIEPLYFLSYSLKNYTNQLTSQVSTYIVENKESRAKSVLLNLSREI